MNALISFITAIVMFISSIFGAFNSAVDFSSFIDALKKLFGTSYEASTTIELYDFDEDDVRHDGKTGIDYVNNIIIVFFEDGVDDKEREKVISSVGGKCVGRIDGVRQWQVEVEKADYAELERKCDILRSNSKVSGAFVELAGKIDSQTIPNDPWGGASWSESSPEGYNWAVEAIHAPSAWSYSKYFNHIDIGMVDIGFYLDHEEISGRIDFPESTYDFSAVDNQEIHGTHVASIMGAKANNNKGLAGLVWDSNIFAADVVPTDDQSFDSFTYCYAGVVACIQNGAKVVNASIGVSGSLASGRTLSKAQIRSHAKTAASYMAELLESGYDFIIVQSAGNGDSTETSIDSINNGMFCCIQDGNTGLSSEMDKEVNDRVIVVGAAENLLNNSYRQPYFTNAGANVDICAPGYEVFGAGTKEADGKNSYYLMSGTSQAAPHVTGVASLVWSVNPELTGADVKGIICDDSNSRYTVADSTDEKHPLVYEYNLLDAQLCVEAAIETLPEADRTWLDVAVNVANGIDRTKYSEESLEALDTALANVKYYKNQEETDRMTQALNEAIRGLDCEDIFVTLPHKMTKAKYEENAGINAYESYYDVPGAYIGTGSTLKTYNGYSVPQEEYVFVVVGDINGDGIITSYDQTLLKKGVDSRFENWSQALLKAADINEDGNVNASDYFKLRTNLKSGIYL